jgi:hypothetical protein
MLTAIFAVENIKGANHNIWAVNDEQEYLEQETASSREKNVSLRDLAATQPQVPLPLSVPDPATVIIRRAFARIDGVALGAALSLVSALYVFLPTLWLLVTGTQRLDPGLYLLSQYFIGYTVSWRGAVVGLLYGAILGFVFGWSLACLRNGLLTLYLRLAKLMEELRSLQEP